MATGVDGISEPSREKSGLDGGGRSARRPRGAARLRSGSYVLQTAALAVAYLLGAKLGLRLAFANRNVTAVWPPTGIAVAGLLLGGPRLWPGVVAGALAANLSNGASLATSAGICVGNTIAPILAFRLLRRIGFRPGLDRIADVVGLVSLGAFVAMLVSATSGMVVLWLTGEARPDQLGLVWLVWWVGDAMGVILLVPFLLTARAGLRLARARWPEAAALAAALTVAGGFAFGHRLPPAFLVFPLVCWAAVRFSQPGAAAAVLLASIMAIRWATVGGGPFAVGSVTVNLLSLQAWNATLAITALCLAAAKRGQDEAQAALRRLAEELEERVRMRTAELRTSEEHLREAQALAHLGSWHWDAETGCIAWSEEMYRIFGLQPETFRPTYEGFLERLHPGDRPRIDEMVRRAFEDRSLFEFEHRVICPDGEVRWLHSRGSVTVGLGGRVLAVHGTAEDITERKRGEGAARRLASIVESSDDAIISKTLEGVIASWNRGAERLYGYTEEEVIDQPISILLPPDRKDEPGDILERIRRGEGVHQYETVHMRKDDSLIAVSLAVSPLRDAEGRIVGASAVARDITERREARRALQESEARLRGVIDTAKDAFVAIDERSTIIDWNPAAERIFGYTREEIIGRRLVDTLMPPGYREAHLADLRRFREMGGRHTLLRTIELPAYRRDGTEIPVELTIWPRLAAEEGWHFNGFIRDLTERKKAEAEKGELEAQLHHSQRLESLGRLAGGVAHDFNNLLAVVRNYATFASEEIREAARVTERQDLCAPILKDLGQIELAAERATTLTHQLLAFGRRETINPEVLDLNDVVLQLEGLLRRTIGEDIEIAFLRAGDLGRVKVDRSQLEQVFINLAVNARDAIRGSGMVSIETSNVLLGEEYARLYADVVPGRYVVLTVTDNGDGMDEEVMARAFEPFFTTKPKGLGSGLGLATAYGIVAQAGGHIHLDSQPGQGTMVKVYLPAVEQRLAPTDREAGKRLSPGRGETVLVVEDEEAVRALIVRILSRNGYTALDAGGPVEALRAAATPERLDLLLTDVVMPHMSGKELAERVNELRPGIKVLFTSGYPHDVVADRGAAGEGMRLVQKPFTEKELLAHVREALDE